jgi:transcriptional regulator with XRE-family HTH domain
MALFFDAAWFDQRLLSLGLSHAAIAAALGLSEAALGEVWKDQRELSARDVAIIASLLDTPAAEIARHAGISTPVPGDGPPGDAGTLDARLARIEQTLAQLTELVRAALER